MEIEPLSKRYFPLLEPACSTLREQKVDRIYVAPGNGGTAQGLAKVSNVSIPVDDFSSLVSFAKANEVNLVVPGPEAPLVAGVVDYFKNGMISPAHDDVEAKKISDT